jgi:hypothetical protein
MSVATAVASDKLSPAEEAFFTSGGSDVSAFEKPSPAAPSPVPDAGTPAPGAPAREPAATVAGQAAPAGTAAAPAAGAAATDPNVDEFDEFEREAFDEAGNARNNGQFIRRANFRVVSGKYKATKEELRAEREARKVEQTELSTLREQRARLDERLRLFNETTAPKAGAPAPAAGQAAPAAGAAAADAPPPDPEQDIFGYVKWQGDQIVKLTTQLGKTQENVDKTAQTFQETTADQSLRTAYGNDARRFAGENPDFGSAYTHYLTVRHATLEAAGYIDQAERRQIIEQEERDIVKRAFEGQRSPAATIYAIAKQIGYQKPAAPPAVGDPALAATAQPAPGAAPPPAAPAAPSAVDQVNKLAAAQAASRSLSSAGGSPVIQMSIDTLLAMSDSEFATYERANPGVVKQLMGG